MKRSLITTIGAAVISVAITIGVGGVAGASPTAPNVQPRVTAVPPVDLTTAKQRCVDEIVRRLRTLGELQSAVTNSSAATAAHKGALAAELSAETSGLTVLQGQIGAATDAKTLRDLCPKIVYDYRVYVLEVPTVHLTLAGDRLAVARAQLVDVSPKLNEAIAAAKAKGKDTSAADAAYADMQAKLAASQNVGATGDTVIAVTPAEVNSGGGVATLNTARDGVVAARTAITQASQDARSIVKALRAP